MSQNNGGEVSLRRLNIPGYPVARAKQPQIIACKTNWFPQEAILSAVTSVARYLASLDRTIMRPS